MSSDEGEAFDWSELDDRGAADGVPAPEGFKACAVSEAPGVADAAAAWLIQAPADFDIGLLDGIELKEVPGREVLGVIAVKETGVQFELRVSSTNHFGHFVPLLPSGRGGHELTPIGPFRRVLQIVELPSESQARTTTSEVAYRFQEVPKAEGLRVRFLPAGCSADALSTAPRVAKSKRRKEDTPAASEKTKSRRKKA